MPADQLRRRNPDEHSYDECPHYARRSRASGTPHRGAGLVYQRGRSRGRDQPADGLQVVAAQEGSCVRLSGSFLAGASQTPCIAGGVGGYRCLSSAFPPARTCHRHPIGAGAIDGQCRAGTTWLGTATCVGTGSTALPLRTTPGRAICCTWTSKSWGVSGSQGIALPITERSEVKEPAGNTFMSPSMTIPELPTSRSCRTSRQKAASPLCGTPAFGSPVRALPSNVCSPTTVTATFRTASAKPARCLHPSICEPGRARHKPTGKPNDLSKPCCANGPTDAFTNSNYRPCSAAPAVAALLQPRTTPC